MLKTSHRPAGFQVKVLVHDLKFRLTLTKDYPYSPPVLECLTVVNFPSIADGRNLVQDVVNGFWSPAISLFEIITQLPEFVKQNKFKSNVGNFEMFRLVDFSEWSSKPDMRVFNCEELDSKYETVCERVCLVSHCYVIILQIDPHLVDCGYIIYIQHFSGITSIKRNSLNQDIVCLTSNKNQSYLLKFAKAGSFIKLLSKNCKLLKALYQNSLAMMQTPIYMYINQIHSYEEHLSSNPTQKSLQVILRLYQSIIEFYSALSDERYHVYLKKSQTLLEKL